MHGEIGALERLLERLDDRPVVFVGDLVDRGPDSVAVVDRVEELVLAGRGLALLGNHEFNLLRGERKHGNRWFFGEQEPDFASRPATEVERGRIARFFANLPLALERLDLRVVHAAWREPDIEALRGATDVLAVHDRVAEAVRAELEDAGIVAARREARARYGHLLRDPDARVPYLEALARYDAAWQVRNPVRVVTSGTEAPAGRPIFLAGRWRMVERTPWWEDYGEGPPVLVGHYWRRRDGPGHVGPGGPLAGVPPFAWMGPARRVFCVDYGVGLRSAERRQGRDGGFRAVLGAMLVPEWRLVFDDGVEVQVGPPGG